MNKADEYRANAAECERMAQWATTETDRQTWLEMARHWFRMSNQQTRGEEAGKQPDTDPTRTC